MDLLIGASAFVLWAAFPFYFKAVAHVHPGEIIAHRVFWSAVTLIPLAAFLGQLPAAIRALKDPLLRRGLLVTSLLTLGNMSLYVLAVVWGHVLEASLAYFLCPLITVALGVFVLGERLSRAQAAAVLLAAVAVIFLMVQLRVVPYLALSLAVLFAVYGLQRKRLPVSPAAGLLVESILGLPAAAALFLWVGVGPGIAYGTAGLGTTILLSLAGAVTALPLLLWNLGAKRLPLATMGVLQFIVPSLLFVEGVFIFGEPLEPARLVAFGLIWVALLLYSLDTWLRARRTASAAASPVR
ncbi:MAG: EamA family transporter RarD [Geminicoccaceae bacterium]